MLMLFDCTKTVIKKQRTEYNEDEENRVLVVTIENPKISLRKIQLSSAVEKSTAHSY